ncbi:DUF4259 domain-containing protein [Micromonospora sp. NBC_00858]|uniref:DUF4259 domain-containing protein n=1 Tax=Micromonospora sp. NBC_00858 TaxID=2975979 RepID=UPI003869FA58|nr:DUF4259 domain-containing protein [Micromonospora sp. NBC_00858]
MGAWGPGLFSDDTACDVRDEYREMLEDGVDDDEATQRMLDSYADALDDPDEATSVWLALAVTQSKLGRLHPTVRDRAIAAIDSGADLARWSDTPRLAAKRRDVLEKARAQLTGPQPQRKKVRRPSRHVTDLQPGDVLSHRAANGNLALLRVARIDVERHSVAPVLVALDFTGTSMPTQPELDSLADKPQTPFKLDGRPLPSWASASWLVAVNQRVDYNAAGFHRAGRTIARPGDPTFDTRTYTSWQLLQRELERTLTDAPVPEP